MTDRWIQLAELAKLFGLSHQSLKRLAKNHGFPLRRLTLLTRYATPGVVESELMEWLKAQPRVGLPVVPNGREDGRTRT
jgi:predicted DNA-binding transcriptional regulator AlpA